MESCFKEIIKEKIVDDELVYEITTPSGQMWQNWSETQKQEWREMIEHLGKNPEDYLSQMRRMLPVTPRGRR